MRFWFSRSYLSVFPSLGVVVDGTKLLAGEGVCLRLNFPCFCRIYALTLIACGGSSLVTFAFRGCIARHCLSFPLGKRTNVLSLDRYGGSYQPQLAEYGAKEWTLM